MEKHSAIKSSLKTLSVLLVVLLVSTAIIFSASATGAKVPLKIVEMNVGSGELDLGTSNFKGFQAFSVKFNKDIDLTVLTNFKVTHEYSTDGGTTWTPAAEEKAWNGMLVKDTGTNDRWGTTPGDDEDFIGETIPAQAPIHYVESQGKVGGIFVDLYNAITTATGDVHVRTVFIIMDDGVSVRVPAIKSVIYSNGGTVTNPGYPTFLDDTKIPNVDITTPTLTLKGDATMDLKVGDKYDDPGYTAADDSGVAPTVTVAGDKVDTTKAATYKVTYVAEDGAGNTSEVLTRTVIVTAADVPPVTPPVVPPVTPVTPQVTSESRSRTSTVTNKVDKSVIAGKGAGSAVATVDSSSKEYVRSKSSGVFKIEGKELAKVGNLRYEHDTVVNGKVSLRISLLSARNYTQDVLLSGVTTGSRAEIIKARFNKYFSNTVEVLCFDQQTDWQAPVEVAVKIDLTGLNTKALRFFSYDSKTNTYVEIANTNYRIDGNGYVHFTTSKAGDIVITDSLFKKK